MEKQLKLILPKGHIQEKVLTLLKCIGLEFSFNERSYRPVCSDPQIETKMLRTQNIPTLIALGRHDCGFAGYDWIVECQADVVELQDLELDPVKIVAALPEELNEPDINSRRIVVASEYQNLAKDYIKKRDLDAIFVKSFGATEAFPPEDADLIIENTATGTTLSLNSLNVIDELMTSTTRFICNRQALENPWKRQKIEEMRMLMQGCLNAEQRVLLEMNVPGDCFDKVVNGLPCMRTPTISPLYNEEGYAVKVAVPIADVSNLIPRLIEAGALDILVYRLEKIVT